MEVLRRETLEWEKINIRGRHVYDCIRTDGGMTVSFLNTLAVRGKIVTRGLGYCSRCNKIMTKREFEKHKIAYATPKMCESCYYLSEISKKVVVTTGGKLKRKCDLYCRMSSKEITRGMECKSHSCDGEFVELKEKDIKSEIFVPDKILTVARFKTWELSRIHTSSLRFKHPVMNIYADIDNNGYLMNFMYKGSKCYFDGNALRSANGIYVSKSKSIAKMLRRLYS